MCIHRKLSWVCSMPSKSVASIFGMWKVAELHLQRISGRCAHTHLRHTWQTTSDGNSPLSSVQVWWSVQQPFKQQVSRCKCSLVLGKRFVTNLFAVFVLILLPGSWLGSVWLLLHRLLHYSLLRWPILLTVVKLLRCTTLFGSYMFWVLVWSQHYWFQLF